jgi:ATP-dependent Clp protease, protease subunit
MKTVFINFFSDINNDTVNNFISLITNIINGQHPEKIYILFSSNGGGVTPGIVLYNFLKSLPCEITIHNTGVVNSIANVIFMAGKHRFTSPHASFLFHGISWGATNANLNHKGLLEIKSSLESDQQKMVGIITENSKISKKELENFFEIGQAVDSQFARDHEVVEEIKNPEIGMGATLIQFSG